MQSPQANQSAPCSHPCLADPTLISKAIGEVGRIPELPDSASCPWCAPWCVPEGEGWTGALTGGVSLVAAGEAEVFLFTHIPLLNPGKKQKKIPRLE